MVSNQGEAEKRQEDIHRRRHRGKETEKRDKYREVETGEKEG
jgi:hypothetical protein